jgi:hypothetical protein
MSLLLTSLCKAYELLTYVETFPVLHKVMSASLYKLDLMILQMKGYIFGYLTPSTSLSAKLLVRLLIIRANSRSLHHWVNALAVGMSFCSNWIYLLFECRVFFTQKMCLHHGQKDCHVRIALFFLLSRVFCAYIC